MSLEFTLVRRAIRLAVIDGPDAGDNPDILKAQGSVLFEPVIKKGDSIQVQTRGGSETYALAPIECPINDGIISHRGQDGVKLPAGGEAANPSLIRWKATFSRMQAGGKAFTLAPVIFDAVPGGEIDLTMVAPVAGAPEGVVRGPRGTSLESIIVDGSELVFTAVDDAGSFEIARIPLDEMVRAEAEAAADGVRDALAVDVAASQSARDAAEGHANRAATSESNAKTSETNAKQSETNAGDYAAVATTAATEAVDAMERATDLAGGDFATHEYVDEGLNSKAEQKDLESVRGRVNNIEPANANQSGSTVWAHATERGHRLPLGYDENGELDSHAKDAFSKSLNLEDKAGKEDVEFALSQKQDSIDVDNPDYKWAMINTRSQLLMGVRNDGTLIAPKHRLSPPSEYTKNDKGEWVPVFADTSQLTIWGSSTPAGLGSYIADAFADAPVAVNNMAQAGEWAQHSAARMGAIRGIVEPVTIPESGSVPLTFVDFAPRTADYAMRPFTATIAGVRGLVDTTGNDTKFVREEPGDAVTLTEQTEVIPIDGPQTREHVTLFGVGKNNLTQRYHVDLVNEYVDTMVDYLTPKYPRFLILGHHHNTGLAGDDNFARPHVDQVNAYNRDTYGPLFFDTIEVYSDLDRWAEAGITPTQADLDDLALGNKPPSLAHDTSHFNADGYRILATAIREHMADLGWY